MRDAFGVDRPDLVSKEYNPERRGERHQQRTTAGLLGGIVWPANGVYAGAKSKKGYRFKNAVRSTARSAAEGTLASAPGLALAGAGARLHSPITVEAGGMLASGGAIGGGYHGAERSMANAQQRGEIKYRTKEKS